MRTVAAPTRMTSAAWRISANTARSPGPASPPALPFVGRPAVEAGDHVAAHPARLQVVRGRCRSSVSRPSSTWSTRLTGHSTVSRIPAPSSGIRTIAARRYGSCMHGSSGVGHLVDRHPSVTPERLIAQLIPPPTFSDVSFDTYKPDPRAVAGGRAVVPAVLRAGGGAAGRQEEAVRQARGAARCWALPRRRTRCPEQLGEARFAAQDVLREIHTPAAIFTTVRMEWPDYRYRNLAAGRRR